jgi:hypothetical protein
MHSSKSQGNASSATRRLTPAAIFARSVTVAALLGFDKPMPLFWVYAREIPALPEPWIVGDVMTVYLEHMVRRNNEICARLALQQKPE